MKSFLLTLAALGMSVLVASSAEAFGHRRHRGGCGCGGGYSGSYYGGGYGYGGYSYGGYGYAYDGYGGPVHGGAAYAPGYRAYSYEPGMDPTYLPADGRAVNSGYDGTARRRLPYEYQKTDDRRYNSETGNR